MTDGYSERFDHGDVVLDREGNDPDEAVVVNTPATPAEEWEVRYDERTVADDNPDYPADDPVVIVVYRDTLVEDQPHYCGVKPIPISTLNEDGVQWYAFPESRLEYVGRMTQTREIPLDQLDPSPYHSRNFSVDENRDYIDRIADRGYPKPEPLVRVLDDGFEIVNGHKRTWASHVAGLETIPCRTVRLDDEDAARAWANRHLDGYDGEQLDRAVEKLRTRWGDATADIAGVARADGGEQS